MTKKFMLAILLVIGLCSAASAAPAMKNDLPLASAATSEDRTTEAQNGSAEKNESFVIDPARLFLVVEGTETITASFTRGGPQKYSVMWDISDHKIASFLTIRDDHCVIRGWRAGSTQLTATTTGSDGELLSATCDITVLDPSQSSITIDLSGLGLSNNIMDLWDGDTVDLWITGTPSELMFSATGFPEWLTLSPAGHLYGKAPVRAEDDDSFHFYSVTVMAKDSSSGESSGASFMLEVQPQEAPGDKGDGGSGGCNAGFAGLTLSLAGLLCLKKRIGR